MPTFKIQAVNRANGYAAPVVYVDAETEGKARAGTRLSEFPEQWNITVNNKSDKSKSAKFRPVNRGARKKRKAVRAAAGITTIARHVRRHNARLAGKIKRYKDNPNDGGNMPGSAKYW